VVRARRAGVVHFSTFPKDGLLGPSKKKEKKKKKKKKLAGLLAVDSGLTIRPRGSVFYLSVGSNSGNLSVT
jgi:hypothetical protein